MKQSILFAAIVALVCLPALTGCKSRAKRACGSACAPPPAPAIPDQPMAMLPPPDPISPPPDTMQAPSVTYEPAPTAAELEQTEQALAQEQARSERAAREREALRIENEALRRDIDNLSKVVTELPPAPAATPDLDSEAPLPAASGAEVTELTGYLKSMAGVKVEQRGAASVVVLVTDAFRSGSDKLKGDMRLLNALRDTAAAVQQHPGAQVQVVGHTDTQPIRVSGWASNTALSRARAKTVAGVLMDNGVDANRINIDGMGENQPLVMPERTAADRAANRRVEIVIKL